MKDILFNLALIDCLNFCKEYGIKANGSDEAGSHLIKDGRGFKYSLLRNSDNYVIVSVTFHKNSVPTHILTPDYKP